MIERLVIMADGERVVLNDLPTFVVAEPEEIFVSRVAPATEAMPQAIRPRLSLDEIERSEIEAALKRHGWVQARAARDLGLTARQMGYKVRKYALVRPEFS